MPKIVLDKPTAESVTHGFGQTASGLDIPSSVSSSSNLPNAIQFVILMNEFSAVAAAYAAMIQKDEKKILDYIAAIDAADQT